jgi:hypothetical protein
MPQSKYRWYKLTDPEVIWLMKTLKRNEAHITRKEEDVIRLNKIYCKLELTLKQESMFSGFDEEE